MKLRSMWVVARGDHIRVRRLGYWHHGIDCGDGTVIHYAGDLSHRRNASVERASLDRFSKGGRIRTVRYVHPADADSVIMRAEARLKETGYNVLFNNCEHFARWCKTGIHESKQIQRAVRVASAVCLGAGALVAGVLSLRLAHGRRSGNVD
jgi:hypothetical protein